MALIKWLVGGLLALVVISGAGAYYVARHPALVLPTLVRSAGPRVVTPYLRQHALSLAAPVATSGPHVTVRVDPALPAAPHALATAVGRALAATVPPTLRLTPSMLAQVPAILRGALGLSAGSPAITIGAVTVRAATGTLAQGTVTLQAPVTVAGQAYTLTATVQVAHAAVTGVTALQLSP